MPILQQLFLCDIPKKLIQKRNWDQLSVQSANRHNGWFAYKWWYEEEERKRKLGGFWHTLIVAKYFCILNSASIKSVWGSSISISKGMKAWGPEGVSTTVTENSMIFLKWGSTTISSIPYRKVLESLLAHNCKPLVCKTELLLFAMKFVFLGRSQDQKIVWWTHETAIWSITFLVSFTQPVYRGMARFEMEQENLIYVFISFLWHWRRKETVDDGQIQSKHSMQWKLCWLDIQPGIMTLV